LGDDVNMNGNSKVPYTMENIKKCMCPKCPVQANSKCAMDKLEIFLNLKTCLEYIVRQVKPSARILILTSSVFATPVQSGKNIILEKGLLLCTSA